MYQEKNSLLFTFPYDHTSLPTPGICFIQTLLLYKQAIWFLKSIAYLLWVASKLSNPQSLTHAAAAHGVIRLYAFGLAMHIPYPDVYWRSDKAGF